MTLSMTLQQTAGGSTVDLDLEALRIAQIKHKVSKSQPAQLTFVMYQPQHEMPIGIGGYLRFFNSDYGSGVVFAGFIEDVSPGDDSNLVNVMCLDPTNKASKEIPVLSQPWVNGSPPTQGLGSVPRQVFNAFIQGDEDYIHSVPGALTTGNMMATLFNYAQYVLDFWHAGTYENADLDSFIYVPQDKIVFEGENFRGAINSLLQWEPAVALNFDPEAEKWRFQNVYNAPEVTLTLNDFSDPTKIILAGFNINRSIRGRATAVEIYGPAELVQETLYLSNGDLTDVTAQIPANVLQDYSDNTGMHTLYGISDIQVTNALKRKLGRKLLFPVETQQSSAVEGTGISGEGICLEITYDNLTWEVVYLAFIDNQNGIVSTGGILPFRGVTPATPPSDQTIFGPSDVRLTFTYYGTPISVRVPASGYSGTAYTVAGVTTVLRIYDEMLAVGYNPYGQAVTTIERLAQYEVIATKLLQQRCDIVYTGGIPLDGLQYEWLRLNRRINLAGVDGDGNTVTTGWEEIGALLTDVEYDYSESTTMLQLSTDQLELCGFDVDFLRHRMKVKALATRTETTFIVQFATYQSPFSPKPLTQATGIITKDQTVYFDPLNPLTTQQRPL